jgi:hypothetical protein
MTVSKVGVSGDQSLVAGSSFGPYLLMSVPHADIFNTHTWVLDTEGSKDMPLPWQGIWTGTRPVEWMSGPIMGKERIFYISKDYDNKNRVWEAFIEERADNGCPITWAIETRGYFGASWDSDYAKLADKRYAYAEFQLAELVGQVDVGAWWAGVNRGVYKQCLVKRINADVGCIRFDRNIDQDTRLFGTKPQTRRVRTTDIREDNEVDGTSCAIERDAVEETDDAFQLLIVGSGAAAIRWLRVLAMPKPQDLSGDCETNETEANVVRFDGLAAEADEVNDALTHLDDPLSIYESTQTKVLTQDGITVTGTGYSTSLISQADADKLAAAIALEQAERMLENSLPLIISDGRTFSNDGI